MHQADAMANSQLLAAFFAKGLARQLWEQERKLPDINPVATTTQENFNPKIVRSFPACRDFGLATSVTAKRIAAAISSDHFDYMALSCGCAEI